MPAPQWPRARLRPPLGALVAMQLAPRVRPDPPLPHPPSHLPKPARPGPGGEPTGGVPGRGPCRGPGPREDPVDHPQTTSPLPTLVRSHGHGRDRSPARRNRGSGRGRATEPISGGPASREPGAEVAVVVVDHVVVDETP